MDAGKAREYLGAYADDLSPDGLAEFIRVAENVERWRNPDHILYAAMQEICTREGVID